MKRRTYGKYLTSLYSITDLVLVNVLFMIAVVLTYGMSLDPKIRVLWVLVNTSYLPVMLWMKDRVHQQRAVVMEDVIRRAFYVVGIHILFFFSLVAFLEIDDVSHNLYLIFYGLMTVCVPLWWIISRRIIKGLRRRGYNFIRVAIVGTGATGQRLQEELESDAGFGYKVLGFFSNAPAPDFKGKLLGSISDLKHLAKRYNIDQIFYTLSGEQEQEFKTVLKVADDNVIQFYYVPRLTRRVARSFELHTIGAVPVLSIRHNPLNNLVSRGLKRTFDLAFSSMVLLMSPLVLIPVAIAIKMSSPGPIFFKQERTGYRGRTFMCWKFRTMRVNVNSDSQQATATDPRTTRVGKFLRRTSIDELPQFVNVWLGDMSVVGPRPHMLKHTQDYAKLIDTYMMRHVVKPGITGWAQVNGYRGITDELWKMEKRVEYDMWYIENWSLLLDVKIVFRTVINAIKGEKNAF